LCFPLLHMASKQPKVDDVKAKKADEKKAKEDAKKKKQEAVTKPAAATTPAKSAKMVGVVFEKDKAQDIPMSEEELNEEYSKILVRCAKQSGRCINCWCDGSMLFV